MTIQLFRLNDSALFPHPELALDEPNGLLAFGGDLSVERLVRAYENGIFPWFSEGEPLLWWSPNPRGVLFLEDYHCSRSLQKHMRRVNYQVTMNTSFEQVIRACAQVPRSDKGTWITEDMILAYIRLHQSGFAHSVEVCIDGQLVGGLYGVGLGKVFCGESMFHTSANASKIALHYLAEHMRAHGCQFIDCQMQTSHLASMGAKELGREQFLTLLANELQQEHSPTIWQSLASEPIAKLPST